jgi:hypothetical protein
VLKRTFTVLLMLSSLIFVSTAQAATAGPEPTAAAERAAKVMGVSTAQAAEDLAVQHEAFHTIGELIEAGDHVWFDNQDATIHVFGPATSVAVPDAVAEHIVHDATQRSFPGTTATAEATSCGNTTYEYCSPLEAGSLIRKVNGGSSGYCTAGFFVRDYSNNPYVLSAAHCSTWGTTFYTNSFTSDTWPGYIFCEVGPWVTGVSPWSGYDAALEPIASGCGGMIAYYHNWWAGTDTHVQGATNTQFVGEYVCHVGVTTYFQCGTILAVNVTSNIAYETGTYGIKETDQVCGYANHGDSGGPVADGTYKEVATGIMLAAGTYSGCAGGNLWIEQRIFADLNLFHVYVASS